jgi:hypothetical protein
MKVNVITIGDTVYSYIMYSGRKLSSFFLKIK